MTHCKRWTPAVAALLIGAVVFTAAGTESLDKNTSTAQPLEVVHRCMSGDLQAKTLSVSKSGLPRVMDAVAAAATASGANVQLGTYAPIRIVIFHGELDTGNRHCTREGEKKQVFMGTVDGKGEEYTCTKADILTSEKKETLAKVLKAAVSLHSERLSVKALGTPIIVKDMVKNENCKSFTIPEAHSTKGVEEADFVLYVAAMQMPGTSAAWATSCQFGANNRPSVGVSLFSPKYIADTHFNVRLAAHEILHALGFGSNSFETAGILESKTLRGKTSTSICLTSPTVLRAARVQYDCPSLNCVELEDEGGAGRALEHWERRSSKDDLMCSLIGVGYYTAMTLAAMEDLGFYRADYAKAEVMPWGRNAGCKLFEEKCVKGGVSQNPSMFCTDPGQKNVCTSDRRGMGSCGIWKYNVTLPSEMQYFEDPKVGAFEGTMMDGCPAIEPYYNGACFDGDANYMHGSLFGEDARCFDAPKAAALDLKNTFMTVEAICATVKCSDCHYSVKVKGASDFTPCEPGAKLELKKMSSEFKNGTFTCPPYAEVCVDYLDPTSKKGRFTPHCQSQSDAAVGTVSTLAAAWIAVLVLVLYASGAAS